MTFSHPTTIESLDQEGRGVTHVDGKAIFVEGALPGEKVTYSSYRKKPSYEFARLEKLLKELPSRVKPQCPHFGICGGCVLQHMELSAQVAAKQRLLEDNLWHLAKLKPESMLPPIQGPGWGYRHKARLRARYVVAAARALAKQASVWSATRAHEKRDACAIPAAICAVRNWGSFATRVICAVNAVASSHGARSAALPATSGKALLSAQMTGQPARIPSSTGKPNPS
jgi:predicted RNA-binding protein with TRAM domain